MLGVAVAYYPFSHAARHKHSFILLCTCDAIQTYKAGKGIHASNASMLNTFQLYADAVDHGQPVTEVSQTYKAYVHIDQLNIAPSDSI